jgi:hypothetical protein
MVEAGSGWVPAAVDAGAEVGVAVGVLMAPLSVEVGVAEKVDTASSESILTVAVGVPTPGVAVKKAGLSSFEFADGVSKGTSAVEFIWVAEGVAKEVGVTTASSACVEGKLVGVPTAGTADGSRGRTVGASPSEPAMGTVESISAVVGT